MNRKVLNTHVNMLVRWKLIKQLIPKLTLNNTNSKQSILIGLRLLYYPLNNNKLPKVLLPLSSILANFTYLMAFPFCALQTMSCTYFLLFLVPLLGTLRFSESAQPNRVQVRTLLQVTVELPMKQVTNSGSFPTGRMMTFSAFLSPVEDILKIISHRPIAGFLNSVFL